MLKMWGEIPNRVLLVLLMTFCTGCSSETVRRTAYETLQNVHQQECMRDRSMDCGQRESYEDYQSQREALENKP